MGHKSNIHNVVVDKSELISDWLLCKCSSCYWRNDF